MKNRLKRVSATSELELKERNPGVFGVRRISGTRFWDGFIEEITDDDYCMIEASEPDAATNSVRSFI